MTARSRDRGPQAHHGARHAQQPVAVPPAAASRHARPGRRHREESGEIAYFAAFVRQSHEAYVVHDLGERDARAAGGMVLVPKQYAVAEPFPSTGGQQVPGMRLLRWSTYALLAAACGGLGGILLGGPVTLIATVQLQRFALRVRRWRRRHHGPDRGPMLPVLPAAACAERLRLLTAWVQGMLAMIIGVALLALILWHLQ